MVCSLPVALSLAETLRMPLASMSNVDLDLRHAARGGGDAGEVEPARACGCPRRTRARPAGRGSSRSVWLSAAVEKVSFLLVGMVVLRSMSLVITPPSVSTPSDSGVTSSRRMSLTSPVRTPPWMAAPMATTSSGLTLLVGLLAEDLLDDLLDRGHAGRAADQDDFVDRRWASSLASLSACMHRACGSARRGRRAAARTSRG